MKQSRGGSPARALAMYRATQCYESPYMSDVIFHAGERLRFERRETEWPGWVWCSSDGNEAWVPEAWLTIDEESQTATIVREYNARELSIKPGDILRSLCQVSGWALCTNAIGSVGWVPMRSLEAVG